MVIPVAYADIYIDSFSKQNYNLGEEIGVNGYVLQSGAVQGIFKMDFVCNQSTPVFFNLINLEPDEKYDFSQTFPLRKSMVGDCYVSVKLEEDSLISSKESDTVQVSNELKISVRTSKITYFPREGVVVSGDVETINGNIVAKGNVVVEIDGRKYNGEINEGLFSYTLNLPEDVTGGEHNIFISAEDNYGNLGSGEIKISVESVVTNINLEVGNLVYKPGEDVSLTAHVYDQAGDSMDSSIVFELVDPNGNVKEVRNIASNQEFTFKIEDMSVPGGWILRAREGTVVEEEIITVDILKKVDMWLVNNTLFVKNIGNVDYEDTIEVDLKGEKMYQLSKTQLIKPGQTIEFDLSDDVPSGEYEVVVPSNNLITGNVVLGSGKAGLNKNAGYFVVGILFLFLIYMVAKRGGSSSSDGRLRQREIMEGRKMREKLTQPVKKPRFGFSERKINESDMKHWVEKATGEKKDDNKGLFDVFK